MEIDSIFDSLARASTHMQLLGARRKKIDQLVSVQSKRCGNCYHWMKSSCVPEKKNGHFKSCNSSGCGDFSLDDYAGLIAKFQKELAEIEAKMINGARP